MDHSTLQFAISTDINSPFSHSAKVVRTLSSTASSYSRGPSSLIVAGMYVCMYVCMLMHLIHVTIMVNEKDLSCNKPSLFEIIYF